VRVVSDSGEQLGVLQTREALILAEKAELDLVEVAPTANPPVCRIMDYGKFKYREQKKEAEARKKRTETTTKELRLRYITDVGDLETKLKQAREFLAEGDKVKFSMRFKGREIAYLDLGRQKFDLLVARLSDVATIDERSSTSGRMIHIVFAPSKKKPGTPPAPNTSAGAPGAKAASNPGQMSTAAKLAPKSPSVPKAAAPKAASPKGGAPNAIAADAASADAVATAGKSEPLSNDSQKPAGAAK
jgi:translation initiation factor IF-3